MAANADGGSARFGGPGNAGAEGGRGRKLRLDQFLKLRGGAATGGQAKLRIQSGDVRVNGEVETRRGLGLRLGDRVEIDGRVLVVTEDLLAGPDDAARRGGTT